MVEKRRILTRSKPCLTLLTQLSHNSLGTNFEERRDKESFPKVLIETWVSRVRTRPLSHQRGEPTTTANVDSTITYEAQPEKHNGRSR
jgi:hypothetical protein